MQCYDSCVMWSTFPCIVHSKVTFPKYPVRCLCVYTYCFVSCNVTHVVYSCVDINPDVDRCFMLGVTPADPAALYW
ncbi:hypothetical protein NP493_962g00023 [Ridgeia piscesae]|uniref:Uncharacterized protein n=1 Tax=Ridgeia piscesae TaxID=27915 RepID=A0AAD9KJG1_RIDPI|nr:hypothetical protein NP493_962g00023 [Ridgeia piscesae]